MGSRLGTASSEARMTPVEYSVVISSTPEHADGELAQPEPGAEDEADGSPRSTRVPGRRRGPSSRDTVSHVNRAVSPRVTTTNSSSVQIVERTERILVHSASIRRPKPMR